MDMGQCQKVYDRYGIQSHAHCVETTELCGVIAKLEKAICIYCREELGNMNFESDAEALEYLVEYSESEQ